MNRISIITMKNYFTLFKILLVCGHLFTPIASNKICTEKIIDGLLTLHCTGYNEIPSDFKLETEGVIKSMDMSQRNDISTLLNDDFKMSELRDIKKLTLSNCHIREIQDNVFSNLKGLSNLDLSNNNISNLNLDIFTENKVLTIINLSNNKNLSDLGGEFPEIKSLTTIDLSNCNLYRLQEKTFHRLINLATLYLNGNAFQTLNEGFRKPLHQLQNVYLANNPWNCDCRLRELVASYRKTTGRSIGTDVQRPNCQSPPNLQNKYWNTPDIEPDKFVCEPKINKVLVDDKVMTEENEIFPYDIGTNITISCEIWADPPADFNWKKDEVPLLNETRRIISYIDSDDELTRTLKLTIVDSQEQDRGRYECQGENVALAVSKSITLNITGIAVILPPPIISGGHPTKTWLWVLLGMLIAGIVLLLVGCVIFLLWQQKRKEERKLHEEGLKKFKGSQDVIEEPMRVEKHGDTAPLLNRTGNITPTSMPSTTGTESNSFVHYDYRQPQAVYAQNSIPPSPSPYVNVSMVSSRPGSSQSVFTDAGSRRQAYRDQKIDLMSFDTVRYQRRPPSVSSFTSLPPPETHRIANGYVTLPRRPRNPSWGSNSINVDNSVYMNQVANNPNHHPQGYSTLPYRMKQRSRSSMGLHYDTAGPRTTADGYSNLSLNKIDGGSMNSLDTINTALSNSARIRGKIAAKKSRPNSVVTPGTSRSLHNTFSFEPIEEVESTPGGSEININSNNKGNIKENTNATGPKYKKKKPPELTNINRAKLPSNFHQRINEINKSFERPKSMGEMSMKETAIDNDVTSSESNKGDTTAAPPPPPPPPKPVRLHSAPEYTSSNNIIYGTIHEEVEGTAV